MQIYAVPLIFRLVSTIKFNTLPMMPNEQMIGKMKPQESFRSASVLGSSFIYVEIDVVNVWIYVNCAVQLNQNMAKGYVRFYYKYIQAVRHLYIIYINYSINLVLYIPICIKLLNQHYIPSIKLTIFNESNQTKKSV